MKTRILIYAMQGSGASLFAFMLGQMQIGRSTLCIVDLWHPYLAPELSEPGYDAVILKVVATTTHILDDHIAAFKPTQLFLFEQNRQDNITSLMHKNYANKDGTMEQKFRLYDQEAQKHHNNIVRFETLPKASLFPTEIETMAAHNLHMSTWAAENYQTKWGFGGIRLLHQEFA